MVAAAATLLLEYIDFKKDGKSFIFNKIIPLKSNTLNTQFNEELIRLLQSKRLYYDYFLDKEKKYHFKLDVEQNRYEELIDEIKTLVKKLKGKFELSEIQGLEDKAIMLFKVHLKGEISHLLLVAKLKPPKPKSSTEKKTTPPQAEKEIPMTQPVKKNARIAFIIDDIGAYDIGPLELKRLDIPITASVLLDSHYIKEAVYWLKEYQIKCMIHLPMQPTNANGNHYDPKKVITLQSTEEDIRNLIHRARQQIPFAEGINNHQGSLATANSEVMARVMKVIKEEGLFFVDSRTIGNSVAYKEAQAFNIKSSHKDLFLDHIQTYTHSMGQIRKLVEIAKSKGNAIAIGHPFETTLRAIQDSLKYIRSQNVEIVPVRELVH